MNSKSPIILRLFLAGNLVEESDQMESLMCEVSMKSLKDKLSCYKDFLKENVLERKGIRKWLSVAQVSS